MSCNKKKTRPAKTKLHFEKMQQDEERVAQKSFCCCSLPGINFTCCAGLSAENSWETVFRINLGISLVFDCLSCYSFNKNSDVILNEFLQFII